jgi:HK97 family phage major capsid protein
MAETKGIKVSDMKEMIDEIHAKHAETLAKKEKAVKVTNTPEKQADLGATKKHTATIEFFKSLVDGDKRGAIEISKKSWGNAYYKTLDTSNDSALVPVEFATDLIKNMEEYSDIRPYAKVRTMRTKSVNLNELDTKVSVTKVAEGSDLTLTEPTFSEPIMTAESYMGGSDWTYQFEDDEEIGILNELREEFAEQFAKAEQASFLNSVVSGAEGLTTASGVNVYDLGGSTSSGSTSILDITAADVHNAHTELRQLGKNRARNARLFISPDALNAIAVAFTSNVGYAQLSLVEMQGGKIVSIAGLPVTEIAEGQLPGIAEDAVSTKFAFIADLSRTFIIGDRKGVEFDILNQGTIGSVNLNLTGGKMIRGIKRTGQKVVLPENIMFLKTSAT